ncbi:MAG: peptidoglycan DD-metalloendopeptidase family protein [Flavobacteriales bacterium]|nr:peptidase M23 [Flavobacteriales bacterium]MDC3258103.1 peptidoglycan DD-metalloendopeptidase family protein [Flavobacteriales bacterium]MDG1426113.1 peptidoglycan DD-metalloendopeptidase family protein [Flavobacteriales bacterium]MDG1933986.1 peptidoglycan DD-metalloendopeptidase family protein [Flavobacteriales bacterium]MDG2086864.1 peptidoglycan DD-metalloendopeptidase family protein [Flavobacteriales bacterium]|tara:strand:- start:4007 stop:5233 length:1227 start_codon:yes stop_codon:yes gene_type:complete
MKKSVGLILIVISLLFILTNLNNSKSKLLDNEPQIEITDPVYEYGILVDSFNLIHGVVKNGQTLGEILYANHINHQKIAEIVLKSKEIFDVRRVNPGKKYLVINSKDSIEKACYFIYEESQTTYIVVDMIDEIDVYKGEKEIITKLKKSTGQITSSLSEAVENLGVSPRVSIQLSEIYAWTIDFFKIQKGDAFTVYYENNYIDGEYIGIGNILAAEFIHKDKSFYAFYYKANKNFGEYFDEEGRTLRKAFLKAPLDFYRISSRYSKNRKHPVTGKWKGHFGTDYAAPRGTPIMSTANGTVQVAGRTRNNGNYVKIRHNGTYTTQYLHMSKIKPGIRKGVYVKQGETIGYVGSTGLATGPHVCYRFWKNGKQVDPYMQKLPPGDPIQESNKKEYFTVKDSLMNILNNTY